MSGVAAVSVDLDSLRHYCRIHSLPDGTLDSRADNLVYELAIPRFCELFARLKISGTFFAVGEDLQNAPAADALRRASAAGHEIGNHSQSHDFHLTRLTPPQIESEVSDGARSIERVIGQKPVGFRAPGYALSPSLYRAICEGGYLYDSSAFPAAPYYLAKAIVMAGLAVRGKPSRAILDDPAVLGAPRGPYLPDHQHPYRRGTGPVLELPMATTRWTRFPFIGTFVAAFPSAISRRLYLSAREPAFFNFELHGLDLLDQNDGIPSALVSRQRDLRILRASKLRRLETALEWIREDYQVVPLREAAVRLRESA